MMSTVSEVEVGLDAIAASISQQRQTMIKVKANAANVSDTLSAITTNYADVIATIQGFGDTDAYEAATKAKFNKLTTEFLALKQSADQVAGINLG